MRRLALLGALPGLLGVMSCSDDLVRAGEDPPAVVAIQLVEAPSQGLVGEALEIRVRALDAEGNGVPDRTLTVEVESGSGRAEPQALLTDENGEAAFTWTLGTAPGTQGLTVRTGAVTASLVVTAGVPPEPPVLDALQVLSAPDSARVGNTVSVVLMALNQRGAGMAGVTLALEVAAGGGSVPAPQIVTDQGGTAVTDWTLGVEAGVQKLVVTAGELRLEVDVKGLTPRLGRFDGVTGGGQEAPVLWPLPEPLVARLLDGSGRPLSHFPVSWTVTSGGGTIEPASPVTDAEGVVSAVWTLGPEAGEQRAELRASDGQGATLTVGLSALAFTGVRIRSDLPGARERRSYEAALEAWGGRFGSDYSWSVAQGELPPGIALEPHGLLEGVPEVQGTFSVTLRARDDQGQAGERAYELRVCEGALVIQPGERYVREYPAPCGPLLPGGGGQLYRVGIMARGGSDRSWTYPVPGGLLFTTTLEAGAAAAAPGPTAGGGDRVVVEAVPGLAPDATLDPARRDPHTTLRQPGRRLGPPLSAAALQAILAEEPPEHRTFLVGDPQDLGGPPLEIAATLRAVSDQVLYYEDDGLATGGGTRYSDAEINESLAWYDRNGHPIITEAFGGYGPPGTTRTFHDGSGDVLDLPVGDLDRNGKAIALQLRPSLMGGAAGFAGPCDLLPRPEHAVEGSDSCEKSNEGEIVYVLSPGRYLLVHELKHVSSLSWYTFGGGAPGEGWIEEGTAVIASELASRRASGAGPGERVTAARVYPEGGRPGGSSDPYLMWAAVYTAHNFLRAAPYSAITGNPEPNPGSSSFYSASWLFHRYILDRYGSGDPEALMRRLNTQDRGSAGLEAVTGKSLSELFTELMEAVLVEDVPSARAATVNRFSSYDFGGIMEADPGSSLRWPPFVGDVTFAERAWNLPTWETGPNLFQLEALGSGELELHLHSGSGGDPPAESDVALLIVRIR